MIAFLLAVPTAAQPKHIPAGERAATEAGTRQCYDLAGYKTLLKFDVDYGTCLRVRDQLDEKAKLYEESAAALQKAVRVHEDSIALMQKDRDHWFDKWKDENKKRHLAENKPALGSYLAWGTAGVFAVATAVLVTVVFVDD